MENKQMTKPGGRGKQVNAQKWSSSCVDCGASIAMFGSGRPKTVCETCKIVRRRKRQLAHYYRRRGNPVTPEKVDIRNYVHAAKVSIGQCQLGLFCHPDLRCTIDFVTLFAFDHRDPSTKHFTLSNPYKKLKNRPQLRSGKITKQMLDDEIAKCDLLCHNCHAYRTNKEKHHRLHYVFGGVKKVITQMTLWDAA
jgi:hypothetical protein